MEAATTQKYQVELREDVARALWAAMHGDDQCAGDYADRAIVSAITRLVNDMPITSWSSDEWETLTSNLEVARYALERGSSEMSERWHQLGEPPF